MMISIGIDVGTTTICGVAADAENGDLLKSITLDNDSFINNDIVYEKAQNPERIFELITKILDDLFNEFETIVSIGISNQMHGILYVDNNGNALSPLYIWQDERGNEKFNSSKTYAEHLSEIAGYTVAAGFGLTTHYYNLLNNNVPANAVKICTVGDYIAMRLCKQNSPVMHISNAASLGVFNIKNNEFDVEKLKLAKIDTSILPKVISDFNILGEYKGAGVCVAVGDNQASFIGSVIGDNALLINVGTGAQVSVCTNNTKSADGVEIRPLFGEKRICVGASLCGGRAYALLENFFKECLSYFGNTTADDLYKKMDSLALSEEKTEPLKISTLFCGTRNNPALRGGVENLGIENFTPKAFVCGVLNGIADELENFYKSMNVDIIPKIIVGSGNGIRKNEPLKKLLSERFNMQLLIPKNREEASFGAMIASLVASGVYKDVETAENNLVKLI